MIKTFKCKDTEKIFWGQFSRRLPHDIQRLAARKLEILTAASQLNTLTIPPSNHLEALTGNRLGDNTAFVLISNGASAFVGTKVMLMK